MARQEPSVHNQDGLLSARADLELGETMETNPYAYDKAVPWMPQQHKLYADKYVTANTSQQFSKLEHQRLQHRGGEHSPKPAERMSKAQVLELARTSKRWLVLVSLMSFGIFSGLVAYHQVGTTANQTNQAPSDSSQET